MLILIGAVVGGSLTLGAPLLAIPIVFLILVVWGGGRMATRRGSPGIGEELSADDERIEFTDRDRLTLTPSEATPPGRGA